MFIQVCGVLQKAFLLFRELQGLEMYYTMNDHHIRMHHLIVRKQKPDKTFNILT